MNICPGRTYSDPIFINTKPLCRALWRLESLNLAVKRILVHKATQIDFLPSKSGENLVLQFLPDFVSYQEIAITVRSYRVLLKRG
jgi:hypothetical protein